MSAYYRRLQKRFELAVAGRVQTSPYPCEHCAVCAFHPVCNDQWEGEDHLVRVAGIRHDQVDRLVVAGVTTLARLADALPSTHIPRMISSTFEKLHAQAALQVESQHSGKIEYEPLPVESGRGLAILPQRSRGDIILDLEGHPFFEPGRGMEFLFGVLTLDNPSPKYNAFWAHDRNGERKALEDFVDFVKAQLVPYPDLHVYHYAAYETAAIKRLVGVYGTRESEVDDLLRRKTFVNLFTVVRQALMAGVRSYSLKELEPLFGFKRVTAIRSGMDAILEYERWITTSDATLLAAIAAYNEDDCRATLALLSWLHQLRRTDFPWPPLPTLPSTTEESTADLVARQRLREELLRDAQPGTPRWLTAELLEYHRREARPTWWWYFERLSMTPEELVDDSESIGCLESDPHMPPEPRKRSLVHTLSFPPQDHKLRPGPVDDPATQKSGGEITEIDDASGILRLLRGPSLASVPLPRALIATGPYADREQREGVLRFAESILDSDNRYPALQGILGREHPRFHGLISGSRIQTTDLARMEQLAIMATTYGHKSVEIRPKEMSN